MSLLTILRSGIKQARSITLDLQPVIQHKAWIGQNVYGEPVYAPAISRNAIVNVENHLHHTSSGEVVDTAAYVAILEPIKPNGTPGRQEPIDGRDLIILPDGTTGPIVSIEGFFDAETKRPMFSEVWLGKAGAGMS